MMLVLLSPRQLSFDAGGRDHVVVTGDLAPSGAREVARLDRYDTAAIVAAGLDLAARHRVQCVVSFAEADVLAAAQLRTVLDLPGQRLDSAAAYRDKAMMRAHCAAAGLPTPRWASITTRADVRAFTEQHGLPVVVKPRRASGSVGVRILRAAADVHALPDLLPDHLVEQYVPGALVHVDGVVCGGQLILALPAEYTAEGCLAHRSDLGGGSLLLPRDDPRHDPLVTALGAVVAALPGASELLLHAEFFVAPDQPPVLCEIASRLPGHPIPPMLDRALGVPLRELWLRACADAPLSLPDRRSGLVANFGLPPRAGVLRALPNTPPHPWVHDLLPLAVVGDRWDAARYAARKSGDFVLTWTVTAPDLPTLRARVAQSARVLEGATRWEPDIDSADGRAA